MQERGFCSLPKNLKPDLLHHHNLICSITINGFILLRNFIFHCLWGQWCGGLHRLQHRREVPWRRRSPSALAWVRPSA